MKTSVTTGLKLTYVNPSTGETEEIYAEKPFRSRTIRTSGISSAT